MKPKGEPSVLIIVLVNHGGVMWTGKGPQDGGEFTSMEISIARNHVLRHSPVEPKMGRHILTMK